MADGFARSTTTNPRRARTTTGHAELAEFAEYFFSDDDERRPRVNNERTDFALRIPRAPREIVDRRIPRGIRDEARACARL
jgi:hypothetical protein